MIDRNLINLKATKSQTLGQPWDTYAHILFSSIFFQIVYLVNYEYS
jgi:hypothetical protein